MLETVYRSIDILRSQGLWNGMRLQARHDSRVFMSIVHNLQPYIQELRRMRILDIGCGHRFPLTLIFHSIGASVTGIDIDYVKHGIQKEKYAYLFHTYGLSTVIKRFAYDFMLYKIYYKELQYSFNFPLNFNNLDLQHLDVTKTSFPDDSYDLVVSNATFEHISNVPQALSEIKRILKVGGITYIEIHLFTSLTGGHNERLSIPGTDIIELGRIPPWDHLRKRLYPINPSLNKLREHDYRKMFEKEFEIVEWLTEFEEPKRFLKPEIRAELAAYSEEELLKRSIIIIARKRK